MTKKKKFVYLRGGERGIGKHSCPRGAAYVNRVLVGQM